MVKIRGKGGEGEGKERTRHTNKTYILIPVLYSGLTMVLYQKSKSRQCLVSVDK